MIYNRAYSLHDYDPAWPKLFQDKARRLRAILGQDALSIEHVGSTSIPGTVAKPQVDILVTVTDLAKARSYYSALADAGFTPRGEAGMGEEYFTEDAGDKRLTSVHVLPAGHAEAVEMVQLRDYLRAHPADRDRYVALKQRLQRRHTHDYVAYLKGKKHLLTELRALARQWAESSSRR